MKPLKHRFDRLFTYVFKICLPAFLSVVHCIYAAEIPPETERWGLRVAVPQYHDTEEFRIVKASFMRAVQQAFGNDRDLILQSLSDADMLTQVREGNVDVFLSNASVFHALAGEGAHFVASATSSASLLHNPDVGVANTVVCKADSVSVTNISSLKGKNIAACNPMYAMDIQPFLREIADNGLDPETFLGRVRYAGNNCTDVITQVLNGTVEAGVLPSEIYADWSGKHPTQLEKLRIIDQKQHVDFRYVHSTDVYPNWTAGVSRHMADAETINVLLSALLTQNESVRWAVGTQFDTVDNLHKKLKIGRYSYLRYWTVQRIWDEYGFLAGIALIILLGLIFFALAMNRLVKIRTKQLTAALLAQNEFRQRAELSDQRLRLFERMSILNQVSGILVHELRQPLNAIKCYAYGLNHLLNAEKTNAVVLKGLRQIEEKVNVANEIIRKVRSFAVRGRQLEEVDLQAVMRTTIDHYLISGNRTEEIVCNCAKDLFIRVDPYEIELVLLNLMNNASSALKNVANSKISLEGTFDDSGVLITVCNNGDKVSETLLQKLNTPYGTQTVSEGFGLVIVREVLASYGASIRFSAIKEGGLEVKLIFPKTLLRSRKYNEPKQTTVNSNH